MSESLPSSRSKHWMLDEIFFQPASLADTLGAYVEQGRFLKASTGPVQHWLSGQRRILFLASGSSRHASMVGAKWLREQARVEGEVDFASEYLYRNALYLPDSAVIVVSQSGETADTLKALDRACTLGRPTLAVTNVAESSMALSADVAMGTRAGVERAIPATKSFTAQLLVLKLLALLAAQGNGSLPPDRVHDELAKLEQLPRQIDEQLAGWADEIERIADRFAVMSSFLFLGREAHYGIAAEGALKLKESACVPAEAYPSGELKHGPNALVGDGTAVLMLATVDRADADSVARYDRNLALLSDLSQQGANTLAIANRGEEAVARLASATIFVEPTPESLLPLVEVIPLQLFSYFMAVARGIDVDRPRNLVKAVVRE